MKVTHHPKSQTSLSWAGMHAAVLLHLCTMAFGLSFAMPSYSQNNQAEAPTWYQVELILFRQGGNPKEAAEQWNPHPKMDYPLNWISLTPSETGLSSNSDAQDSTSASESQDNDQSNSQATTNTNSRTNSIPLLPASQHTLKEHAQKLQRSNRYRILFHGAWYQGLVENAETPAILIRAGDVYEHHAELEGTIQLKLQRYLHITTDLWLTQFVANFGQERSTWPELPWPPNKPKPSVAPFNEYSEEEKPANAWGEFSTSDSRYDNLLEKPYIIENIAKINETRRMRSNELHYIDHPLLGILIQFTPYQPPATGAAGNADNL